MVVVSSHSSNRIFQSFATITHFEIFILFCQNGKKSIRRKFDLFLSPSNLSLWNRSKHMNYRIFLIMSSKVNNLSISLGALSHFFLIWFCLFQSILECEISSCISWQKINVEYCSDSLKVHAASAEPYHYSCLCLLFYGDYWINQQRDISQDLGISSKESHATWWEWNDIYIISYSPCLINHFIFFVSHSRGAT